MSDNVTHEMNRREMLAAAGAVTAGALAGLTVPAVHAAGEDLVRVALVGCGGRGTGAALQALSTKGPTSLHAAADVFQDRLDTSLKTIENSKAKQMDLVKRKFIGFDAYKEAMDSLRPNDVVILTTPPAFRWVHFKYAISKGLNVFMEKPVTVDGPTSRRMLELNKEAEKKNLKVGVGLMCRHCENRQQLYKKIKDGELGEILTLRAYRMHGPVGSCQVPPKRQAKLSDLSYQIRNFHGFLWASGGCYSDFLIHNIDECCWMKDSWPVKAEASGGRHYRGDMIDQNFDTYSVEYTFEDGAKLFLEGRTIAGCKNQFASYAHGTKGSAIISKSNHESGRCPVYKNQKIGDKASQIWIGKRDEFRSDATNPYQVEWNVLMDAIRNDKKHNEVERGVKASLVTVMGRLAAHTGQEWTLEDTLKHKHEFAPDADKLKVDGEAPLKADQDGKYPVPQPGKKKDREY
jgi:predicted dehydrogenase